MEKWKTVAMPPMAEWILCRDGEVYILFESASDKKVFGRSICGYQIFAYEKEGED